MCRGGGCCSIECCDRFSRPIGLSVADDSYQSSSGWGVCLTILVIIIAALYAIEKLFIQELLASYSYTYKYDLEGSVNKNNGFNVAFALTPYEGDLSKSYENPRTVTIEAELYEWSVPENSMVSVRKYSKLKTHPCTAGELGLLKKYDPDIAKFYPPSETNAINVQRLLGNWHCIDDKQETELNLYGHYDAVSAQALRINLMLCNPTETECDKTFDKSEYLRDKFVTVLTNEMRSE